MRFSGSISAGVLMGKFCRISFGPSSMVSDEPTPPKMAAKQTYVMKERCYYRQPDLQV